MRVIVNIMFSIEYFIRSLSSRLDEKGWSGRKLAIQAGINPAVVRDILNGKSKDPGISKVTSVAMALGCSVDTLVGLSSGVPAIDKERFLTAARAIDHALEGTALPLESWCLCVMELYQTIDSPEESADLAKTTLKKAVLG